MVSYRPGGEISTAFSTVKSAYRCSRGAGPIGTRDGGLARISAQCLFLVVPTSTLWLSVEIRLRGRAQGCQATREIKEKEMARKADIACEWLTGFNPAQSSRGFPCKGEDGRIWFPWGHLFFPFFCASSQWGWAYHPLGVENVSVMSAFSFHAVFVQHSGLTRSHI